MVVLYLASPEKPINIHFIVVLLCFSCGFRISCFPTETINFNLTMVYAVPTVVVYFASPEISCSPWLLFPFALSCLLLEVWLSNDMGSWVGGVFNFHLCVTFTFVFQYIGVTHGLENVVDPKP